MKLKKLLALALGATMVCASFAACTTTDAESSKDDSSSSNSSADSGDLADLEGEINASGSSALKPLADIAVEMFADIAPNAIVNVKAGGSGTGLSDVSQGISDIGNSDITAESKLDAAAAAELVDHKVCTVTMAAVVNADLGLTNISKADLQAIYTGEITDWSEVEGYEGDAHAITLYTRPSSSGTRATFQTFALDGKEEVVGNENDNSGEVQTAVEGDKYAIAYLAMSYYAQSDAMVALSLDGVEPTLENTYNGTYPVWCYEHMYTKGEATGVAKAFIEYMMGDEFAPEIEKAFYGVSSKIDAAAVKAHDAAEGGESSETVDLSTLEGEINASGSSALKPLADIAVDMFADLAPNAIVNVKAGGSGTGLSDVSQGISDIGNSDITAESKLDAAAAAELVDHKVCTVTMAAVVNADLGLTNISKADLQAIYTGEITDWSEVEGYEGDAHAITLYTRPSSSGTRATFQTFALDGKEEVVGNENDNSGEVQTAVEGDKYAIAYLAMSYYAQTDAIVALSLDGVEPTLENTYNGTYPVWCYEHMYTKGEATGVAKAFIEYMMGDEFAPEIEKAFYGVSSKIDAAAVEAHDAAEAGE